MTNDFIITRSFFEEGRQYAHNRLIPVIATYIKLFVCTKIYYLEFFTSKDLNKFPK